MIPSPVSAAEIQTNVFAIANKAYQIASGLFGKAYEWLAVNVPVFMTYAKELAEKIIIAVSPYFAGISTWAIENQAVLTPFLMGVVTTIGVGIILNSLFRKKAPKQPPLNPAPAPQANGPLVGAGPGLKRR